jgi:hypothetical protein
MLTPILDLMREHMICKKYADLYVKLDLSYMEGHVRSVEILKQKKHTTSNEDH